MRQPIFLAWMGLIIIGSLVLIFKAGPKWGKQHMMVYIGVCSLIGSLSVVATQGLGAAIVHNISTGEPQFNQWFTYFVIVFMVVTLLTEINYLNKALNLFNTGFAASVVAILTVCLGFLVICGGVLLLQTSKPAVHMPGTSTPGIETILYEEMEPTAADMRASPFSSIRRISRDLRHSTIGGPNGVFQSSPLNPRTESLLQRKRRASNATQWSRPQSMVSHHLAVPGTNTSAVAGTTTAFYPPTVGAYSTMMMGPHGAQIRLQLCEIVVSDEKHEKSRYQVYRPLPIHGDLSHPTDSRNSSIRFENPPALPHDDNEKDDRSFPQGSRAQRRPAPISGSMFQPPKLAVSPPTPSFPPNASAFSPVPNAIPASLKSPSGPFLSRPRFRSPSTSTAASGDIMEMNDPSHAGRTVVSIEPVQQQPLYSLYVPPPSPSLIPSKPVVPMISAPTSTALPLPATTSITSTDSNAFSTANMTGSDHSHLKEPSQPTSDGDTNDSNDATEEQGINNENQSSPAKPKRGLFGLGKFFVSKDNKHNNNNSKQQNQEGGVLPTNNRGSTLSSESSSSTSPLNPGRARQSNPLPVSSSPIIFNRTNHPTRISEGEEEDDTEDIKPK
ncbi:hypothetical protein BGX27_003989 [Mortierella sp. AM989]|nr:hypothetical protein BGX27_003989 [Mortierella sp. AM989]